MQPYRTEGIILHALPFQDYDLILTLFTAEEGVIKLIVKRALSSSKSKATLTAPLTHVECLYTRGRSDLFKCQELSLINAHLRIREKLSTLEAACELIQAVLTSQPTHAPAPELYLLFKSYLEKLPSGVDPRAFTSSFYLKTLRHEGLMEVEPSCSVCASALTVHSLALGENFCPLHRPSQYLTFSEEEMAFFLQLAHCRSFSQLTTVSLPEALYEKVRHFFRERLEAL